MHIHACWPATLALKSVWLGRLETTRVLAPPAHIAPLYGPRRSVISYHPAESVRVMNVIRGGTNAFRLSSSADRRYVTGRFSVARSSLGLSASASVRVRE